LWSSIAFSEGDAGRESLFSLGAGARGMGMGRAFVSLSGDASATFWNPGATASIDKSEVMAFHTSLFLGTNYECLALSHPLGGIGVFSLSVGRVATDGIERRDEFNRLINEFSSSESQYGLSFARDIRFGLSGGLTLKAVTIDIGNVTGSGFGADLGFQYRPSFIKGVTVGAAFNDLVKPAVKLVSVKDEYQTINRFGISSQNRLFEDASSTVSLDLEKTLGRSVRFRAGLEMAFYRQFSLRLGYDDGRPTFGTGLLYNFARLDYAYENVEYLGGSHRISIAFAFGKSVAQAREENKARIIHEEKEKWQESLESERKSESETLTALADSLKDQEQYHQALGYYQRALALDAGSIRAKTMADSMMNLIVAKAVADAGDRKRKDLIAGRIESALNDFRQGRLNEAISKYDLLLEIDPENETVIDLLGAARETRQIEIKNRRIAARAYQEAGDYVNAIAAWNQLLALDRTDTETINSIDVLQDELKVGNLVTAALAAIENGRYAEAVGHLEQASNLKPQDKTIESLLMEARAKSAPLTTLEDIKLSPDQWKIYLSGLESYQASNYESALSSWKSLREFYPNNPELEKNISQAGQRLGVEGGIPQE
jgi:tetratricopeptide (TPR) repeat protein